MPDPKKTAPRTKFHTIGKTHYGLLLDFNALCDIEDATGEPIASLAGNASIKVARALFWAALNGWVRRDRPKGREPFTVQSAGNVLDELLQEEGGVDRMTAILEALGDAAFPAAAKAAESDEGDDSGN